MTSKAMEDLSKDHPVIKRVFEELSAAHGTGEELDAYERAQKT